MYNYATFVMANEQAPFEEFPRLLPVGSSAPSYPLEDLDAGSPVNLADLWADETVVMEFGSFT